MKRRLLALVVVAAALLAVPATALRRRGTGAAERPVPKATVTIDVGAPARRRRRQILDTVPVSGTVKPYVAGQHVEVNFYLNGKQVVSAPGRGRSRARTRPGTFKASVVRQGRRQVRGLPPHLRRPRRSGAESTVRKSWTVSFPKLNQGECDRVVGAFKGAPGDDGLRLAAAASASPRGSGARCSPTAKSTAWTAPKRRAPGLVKAAFAGKGGYHVQVSRTPANTPRCRSHKQVLVLIKGGKPFAIYPVSTGKPSTPTITGHYSFYRQEPGYNSEGMYYSFYWHNGYAVHGYARSPQLRRQPRLRADLHRRPAADLRTAALRRVDLRLLSDRPRRRQADAARRTA